MVRKGTWRLKTAVLSVVVMALSLGLQHDVYAEAEDSGYDTVNYDAPSDEQVQQWIDDGTWEQRIEFMESVNNNAYILSRYVNMASEYDLDSYSSQASGQEIVLDTFLNAMPSTGDVTIPVFLVQFSDVKNEDATITPNNVKNTLFNEDVNSDLFPVEGVTGYYNRSSYRQLNISGDVYDWITLSNTKEYYQNAEDGRELVIQEIIDAYDSTVDFSRYDSDGDGFIDAMYIMYAGDSDDYGDFYWAYKTYVAYDIQADGVNANVYVWMPSNASARVAIHETGHLLGVGDYYTANRGVGYMKDFGELGGLGYFDMLDSNVGDMNIFTKMLYGWVEPVFVTSDTDIDLYPVTDGKAKAVIVTDKKDNNIYSEYYILELFTNEQNNWDSAKAENGAVRIYHVDAEIDINEGIGRFKYSNDAATSEFKLLRLMESDGKDDCAFGSIILPESYYYAGMSFGPNTAPSSEFYGGEYTGIQIDINSVSNEKASISVRFVNDTKSPEYAENNDENVLGFIFKYGQLITCFDSYIYEGSSFERIKLYKKDSPDKLVEIEKRILSSRDLSMEHSDKAKKSNYNQVIVNIIGDLESGAEYVLEYPEGAVCDAAGNANKLIQRTYTAAPDSDNIVEIQAYASSTLDYKTTDDNLPVITLFSKTKSVTANKEWVIQLRHCGMRCYDGIYNAMFVNKAYANALINMRKVTEPVGIVDDDGFPYIERTGSYELNWAINGIADITKVQDGDGYIFVAYAMKKSLDNSGWGNTQYVTAHLFRLDKEFNVLWGTDVSNIADWAGAGISRADYSDGKIYVKTGDNKILVLNDIDSMLIKAEKNFKINNLSISNGNVINTGNTTVGGLRSCFSGDISDIEFYNSNLDIVENNNDNIAGGLIKVTSGDYSWYYRIGQHEHSSGDWIIDKPATVSETGSRHKECTECGYVMEIESIDKLTPTEPEIDMDADTSKYYNVTTNGGSWDGTHYYLPSGQMVRNSFFSEGTYTYYLQADGTPMKDRLTYHPDGVHVIYFDADGHEVFSDFAHISKSIAGADVDDMCFFNVYGYMYVDTLTYDKTGTKLYYVNPYGVLERNGWFQFSGHEFDAGLGFSGKAGGYGYANSDCSLMVNTNTYDWNGNFVYMQGDGHMAQ